MTNETIGEALPREQARVRELLAEYWRLGTTGAWSNASIPVSRWNARPGNRSDA